MAAKKLALLGLLAMSQAWLFAQVNAHRQQRQLAGNSRAKHPAVQTWEGEGGALPLTGAQLGPDPSSIRPAGQPGDPMSRTG